MLNGPIARGTIRASGVLGLRLVVQAGTLLLVARMLGPDRFGAFAGVAALAVILGTLSTFGTNTVLLGEVSKEPSRRQAVLPYAIPLTLLGGSILLGVYLSVCTMALHKTGVTISVLLSIGVTETLLQPLFVLPAMEHMGLGRIARSQMLLTLPLVLRLLAAATVFLVSPADPLSAYAYGYFGASVVALVIATAVMPAPWPAPRTWHLPSKSELRDAAGYAAINVTALSPAELDKTLAVRLLPAAASGVYAAAARVTGAATLPVIAMMVSALPRLFREGQGPTLRTRRLLRWIWIAALSYSVALAVLLWFIAPIFVWVFGARYAGIVHTIRWLTPAVPAMALRLAAGSVLAAMAKPWLRVGFELVGLLVLIAAAIMLVGRLGQSGMLLALVSAEWTMAVLGWLLVHIPLKTAPGVAK